MNPSEILRAVAMKQASPLMDQLLAIATLFRPIERALDEIVADSAEEARLAGDCVSAGSVLVFPYIERRV